MKLENAHLCFWIRTSPPQFVASPEFGDLLVQLVREYDGQRHAFLGFVGCVTKHQALYFRHRRQSFETKGSLAQQSTKQAISARSALSRIREDSRVNWWCGSIFETLVEVTLHSGENNKTKLRKVARDSGLCKRAEVYDRWDRELESVIVKLVGGYVRGDGRNDINESYKLHTLHSDMRRLPNEMC